MKCNIKIKSAHIEPTQPFTYFMAGDRYWRVICSLNKKRTFEAGRIGGPGAQWQESFLDGVDEALKLPFDNWNTVFFKVSEIVKPFFIYEYKSYVRGVLNSGQTRRKTSGPGRNTIMLLWKFSLPMSYRKILFNSG